MKLKNAETEEKYIKSQGLIEALKTEISELNIQLDNIGAASEKTSEMSANFEAQIESLKADLDVAHTKIQQLSEGRV